ncbi:hypothetical protein [Pedobacter cryoconitis]|nr:hypothetical protein [Pedobacter cryoconitis]
MEKPEPSIQQFWHLKLISKYFEFGKISAALQAGIQEPDFERDRDIL